MRNVWLTIRHEIASTASRRSFWLMTFLFPLLIIAISIIPQVSAARMVESQSAAGASGQGQMVGYVDAAGIIRRLPSQMPAGSLKAFADEPPARAAAAAGEITGYYVVPADYVATGRLTWVARDVSPLNAGVLGSQFDYILRYNLTGDEELASLLIDPTPSLVLKSLTPAQAGPAGYSLASTVLPLAVMFILFFVISMSAGYMLQSVVREKENRTVEVLLMSLHPRELMLGKVLGLGALALFQMAIWMGGGMLAANSVQTVAALVRGLAQTPVFLLWAFLFFVGGYLVYASALGALGALAPNLREGSQFTFVFLLPLMLPVWLNAVFTQAPNGVLATAFSLFPLTAPTAMMTRLAAGGVPLWQPVIALAGLAATAYLFVTLAARFFRADTLLSTGSLSWRRIAEELRR